MSSFYKPEKVKQSNLHTWPIFRISAKRASTDEYSIGTTRILERLAVIVSMTDNVCEPVPSCGLDKTELKDAVYNEFLSPL